MVAINISYDEAVGQLRKGIVRAVFVTRDKRNREIFATRNSQLMAKLGAVSNSDYSDEVADKERTSLIINVYDLQKLDFRKINLNTLKEFDTYTDKIPPLEDNLSAIPLDTDEVRKATNDELKEMLEKKLEGTNLDKVNINLSLIDESEVSEPEKSISSKQIEEIFSI